MRPNGNRPLSFHPTISFAQLFGYLGRSCKPPVLEKYLDALFPGHKTYLTDSGRSAFALAIEKLDLRGKTMVLPAYVCDALLPALIHYDIRPLFLDVDTETYQPPLEAYTNELLDQTDAILLVATYGRKPDERLIALLQERGKVIIEDYAPRNPLLDDEIEGTVRIYSLPKMFPMPDGGLIVLPQDKAIQGPEGHRPSLSFIKNLFKLLPFVAPLIARIRDRLSYTPSSASWSGVSEPSNMTKVIFSEYCNETPRRSVQEAYTYCYPLRVKDPKLAIQRLWQHGITAERIWHHPIIVHPEAKEHFGLEENDYPHTMQIASEIVAAPLWHVNDQESYNGYVRQLEEILGDLLCE